MERKRLAVRSLMVGAGALLVAGGLLFGLREVHAVTPLSFEDIGTSIGLTSSDLKTVVLNIIRWALGIMALVAVSFIIYGGYVWLTAAGNVERIQKAKRIILNAVIGLVIVLLAWAIVFFVARAISNSTGGGNGGPGCTGPGCVIINPPDGGFEIRSIVTDCGSPPAYESDVFRCSAVQITFNHTVKASTVQAAVNSGQLVIKQCADASCADSGLTMPNDSAVDGEPGVAGTTRQAYSPDNPTLTRGEWTVRSDNSGKTITFLHAHELFPSNPSGTFFKISIPTSITDNSSPSKSISQCRRSTAVGDDIPGCVAIPDLVAPTKFEWTMLVGNNVDTTPPKVSGTYPTSAYKPAGPPDQNVPRTPIITVNFDQAILGLIDQGQADPLNNTVALIPFTPNTATSNPEDGTDDAPFSPNDFTVVVSPDSTGLQIQLKAGKTLEKFQWYRVQIKGIRDLCSNLQAPDPYSWVFETNDVVPAIADHYPQNGTTNACADTPIFIRYTVSMYDINTSTCNPPNGYVTDPYLNPAPATGTKTFDVTASQRCSSCADPQNKCMVFEFRPPPPFPSSSLLQVGSQYRVGVDNRYIINDQNDTLRFGEGLPPGPPSLGQWHFDVAPAGSCVNKPVITSIDPPDGTNGQCLTVGGYFFDPTSNGRAGGDDLLYEGGSVPPSQPSLSWADTQIVTEAPDETGITAPVTRTWKVKAEFPAPFGVLESDPFPWTKRPGSASQGPCLISVNPPSGYNLDPATLNGKRFDATSSVREVHWRNVTQNLASSSWTDTSASTSVPPQTQLAPPDPGLPVWVENDAGPSNRLTYDLKQFVVPPGTPEPPIVIDRWPNCGMSCVGADVGLKLGYPSGTTLTMDATTFTTGTAIIRRCTTDACTAFTGADITPVITYDGSPSNMVHFPPPITLLPNTAYRVVFLGTVKDSAGTSLAQLNYDNNGDSTNESYSWTFKTQSGTGGCQFDRVEARSTNGTAADIFVSANEEHDPYVAYAFSEPNECSASGQLLAGPLFNWSWRTSNPAISTVTQNNPPPLWTAKVKAVTEGNATISSDGREISSGILKTGSVTVTNDFSFCNDSTDCTQAGLCPGSTCDDAIHRCTPVITSVSPTQGDIGTWTGISGCYFGNYSPGKCVGGTDADTLCDVNGDCDSKNCREGSAVIYTNDKRGVWPNPALCGSPATQWRETSITSEVPDRNDASLNAASGPLVVQRSDGARTPASADSFIVTPGLKVPGICSVAPAGGSEGVQVTLKGQEFGASRAPADSVTFFQEKTPSAGDYVSWANTEIVCRAPNGISNNTSNGYEFPAGHPWDHKEISVVRGGQWSNVVDFNVVPPGCQICTADNVCGAGNSCGYNGCCTSSPTVVSTNPTNGEANVCRNSWLTATFSKSMDAGTMNASTVHLYKGSQPVTLAGLNYDDASKTLRINPGYLDRNRQYTVSLSAGNILDNPSFESFSGGSATSWAGSDQAQSTDIPAGAIPGSHSVMVDGTSVVQAYAAQNPGVESSLQRKYHVTGWVKFRIISGSGNTAAGGLITRCWGSGAGSCLPSGNGFDQYNAAFVDVNPNFGLFRYNSAGQNIWHYVDFTVTNNTGQSIGPSILCFANNGAQVWCDDVIVTEVGTSGIRSADGGNLQAYDWSFTTADASGPCGVDQVVIDPSTWNFPNTTTPKTFTAHAMNNNGIEVAEIPGVYEWRWNWSVVDTTIADFTAAPGDNPTASVAAKQKKGGTYLKAEVQPISPAKGLTTTVGGLAVLGSTVCDNLWNGGQFVDSASNCKPGTGACKDYHFSLSYCKDGGLPELTTQPITGEQGPAATGLTLLKEFLFKDPDPKSVDAIGIRIYNNVQSLSVREWYNQNVVRPGSPESTNVDGYDAIRDGRSIYVGATDFDGANFVSRIYIISYTQNPTAQLQSIYNQLLESWYLNNNVLGVCHQPPVSTEVESDKTCVQRDLKRLAALSDMKAYLRIYRTTNGNYPKLDSGSYLPQLSFSVWPSWQQQLGGDLGQRLATDPKNTIANCPAGQNQDGTCWNETNKKFVCLPDAPYPASATVTVPQSHILGYKATADGSQAKLYADLEYRHVGSWINYDPSSNPAICSSPSSCKCFNYSDNP